MLTTAMMIKGLSINAFGSLRLDGQFFIHNDLLADGIIVGGWANNNSRAIFDRFADASPLYHGTLNTCEK